MTNKFTLQDFKQLHYKVVAKGRLSLQYLDEVNFFMQGIQKDKESDDLRVNTG